MYVTMYVCVYACMCMYVVPTCVLSMGLLYHILYCKFTKRLIEMISFFTKLQNEFFPGVNVIKLCISVLRTFSLYFHILYNGDIRIYFSLYGNTEQMSVIRKYKVL